MSVQLSAHFLLSEMTVTNTGLPNTPTAEQIDSLRLLCVHVLEPWRKIVGALKVNSGFRAPDVNRAVHGSRSSQHCKGEAADVICANGRGFAWRALQNLIADGLPVDQALVYEDAPHIHVSFTQRYPPRRQVLVHRLDDRYVEWATYTGPLLEMLR